VLCRDSRITLLQSVWSGVGNININDLKARILSDYDTESGILVSKSAELSADDLYREDLINGIVRTATKRENPAKKLPLVELVKGLFKESPLTREYFIVVCIRTFPIYMAVTFVILMILFRENLGSLVALGVLWAGSILAAIAIEIIIWTHLPDLTAVENRKEYEKLIKSAKEAIR